MIPAKDAYEIIENHLMGKMSDVLLKHKIAALREKYKDQNCYFSKSFITYIEDQILKEAGIILGY